MSGAVKQGYKRTEVGVIPDDWSVHKLNEIGDTLIGLTYSPRDVDSDGILVLRSSNIQNGKLDFNNNVYVKCPISQNIMVQNGDILICVRNGSRDLIGKSAILDKRTEGMSFGAFMSVFRSHYGFFLANYFKSHIFYRQVHEHLGATINQITNKSLNSFLVALPPLPEQRAIASALADMDALLDFLEELLTKKRQLKQATMQELLTGTTRLEGFEGEWEEKRLGDVIQNLVAGVSVNSFESVVKSDNTRQAVLKTSCVDNGKFFADEYKPIEGAEALRARVNPVADSIIISRMNTPNLVGECGYVYANYHNLFLPDRLWRADGISGIISMKWLAYLLSSKYFKWRIKDLATGTSGSMKNIAKGAFLDLDFLSPLLPEQKAIAAILSEMDAELEALEERVTKTRDLKQGMMQELLTGRTRLL